MKLATLSFLALLAAAPVAAQAPATADLTGTWQIKGYSPNLKPTDAALPPFTRAGKAAYDKNLAMAAKGDRSFDEVLTSCLPPGLPRLMTINKPFQIVQKPNRIFFIHQENRLPRKVFMNEALPVDPDPLYDGFSVGKWEGDTLVVDSAGFREGTLLDDAGLPHTEALKLTERYRLVDRNTLEGRYTIEDKGTFSRPWTAVVQFERKTDYLFPEEVCAERLKTTAPKSRQQAQQ
jgi:hypothetical protein